MNPKFGELIGAIGYLTAIVIMGYLAIVTRDPVVIGGAIAITASGNGYFLRAKVQESKP